MLRLKNITKAYEDNIVFNDAEISFPETGLILLYGHNGAGKSTLLSLISGNDINYQGSITIDDTIINNKNLDYYKDNLVQYIPQEPLIFNDLSTIKNLLVPFFKHNKKKALNILKQVGLEKVVNQRAGTLSTGEKQRLSFARGIYANKSILLLDEVFSNLKEEDILPLIDIIKEYSKTHLVILSTHDEIEKYLDNFSYGIYLIENKKIEIIKELQTQKSLKNNFKSKNNNIFNFFLTLKNYLSGTILIVIFVFLMTYFPLMYSSFSNSQGRTRYPEIYTQEFLLTSPALLLSSDGEEDLINPHDAYLYCVPILDNDVTSNKTPGAFYSGILALSKTDKDDLKILKGALPSLDNEMLISSLQYNYLSKYLEKEYKYSVDEIDDYLFSEKSFNLEIQNKKYKLSGVYQCQGESLKRNIDNSEEGVTYNIERILYGYLQETVFVTEDNSLFQTDDNNLIVPNVKENQINGRMIVNLLPAFNGLVPKYLTTNIIEYMIAYDNEYGIDYFLFGLFGFVVMTILLSLVYQNKRRYVLLRIAGASRKQLIWSPIAVITMTSLIGYFIALSSFYLTHYFLNLNAFGNNAGLAYLFIFNPPVIFYVLPLIAIIVFVLIFFGGLSLLSSNGYISQKQAYLKQR